MFTTAEEALIRRAGEKHSVKIMRRVFTHVVEQIKKTLKEHPELSFVEARRLALNANNIWGRKERRAYNSALGAYFGQHGSYKAAKRTRAGAPKKVKREGQIPLELDQGGQYRVMI